MRSEGFFGSQSRISAGRPDQRNRLRYCALAAGLLLGGFFANAAAAQPKTINDCEKIQAADAYNQCLALFGPAAHEHGAKIDPESSGGKPVGEPKAETGAIGSPSEAPKSEALKEAVSTRHRSGRHYARHFRSGRHFAHHSGRKRASFFLR